MVLTMRHILQKLPSSGFPFLKCSGALPIMDCQSLLSSMLRPSILFFVGFDQLHNFLIKVMVPSQLVGQPPSLCSRNTQRELCSTGLELMYYGTALISNSSPPYPSPTLSNEPELNVITVSD